MQHDVIIKTIKIQLSVRGEGEKQLCNVDDKNLISLLEVVWEIN